MNVSPRIAPPAKCKPPTVSAAVSLPSLSLRPSRRGCAYLAVLRMILPGLPLISIVIILWSVLPGPISSLTFGSIVFLVLAGTAVQGWALGKSFRVSISEEGIRMRGGVLRRSRSASPPAVSQEMQQNAGPLARLFSVSQLTVNTASRTSRLTVPALDTASTFQAMTLISVISAQWANPVAPKPDLVVEDSNDDELKDDSAPGQGIAWARFHPLSPLVRAFVTISALLLASAGFNYLWTINAVSWLVEEANHPVLGLIFWVGLGVSALATVGFVLQWRFRQFAVDEERLYLRSGVLIRRHRSILLERVQSIDLEQPEYLRPLGLVALTLNVAEQDQKTAQLRFLRRSDAERLRTQFLSRDHIPTQPRVDTNPPEDSSKQGGDLNSFVLPGRRIFVAMVWSWGTLILLAAGLMAVISNSLAIVFALLAPEVGSVDDFQATMAHPLLIIPLVIAALSAYWGLLKRISHYRAQIDGTRLTIQAEFVQRVHYTIPIERLQSLRISQPLIYRPFGWYKVSVIVAGYGFADQDKTQIIPAGSLEEVTRCCQKLLLSGLNLDVSTRDIRIGLLGYGPEADYSTVPWYGQWRKPWAGRRSGFYIGRQAVLMRDGVLLRRVTLIPFTKLQTVTQAQGIMLRIFKLWRIQAHLTDGTYTAQLTAQHEGSVKKFMSLANRTGPSATSR